MIMYATDVMSEKRHWYLLPFANEENQSRNYNCILFTCEYFI